MGEEKGRRGSRRRVWEKKRGEKRTGSRRRVWEKKRGEKRK